LVARERETYEETMQSVPGLKQIKVSRRYARAFDRLSSPRASSSRALALALVTLVFASGFLLGRVGSIGTSGPAVRELPSVKALAPAEVKGSVSYITTSREGLETVAFHDLFSGYVTPRAQFSSPFDRTEHVTTQVMSFGRSVAVIATAAGKGYVAFAPHNVAPQGWVPGIQAAWSSERELLVRHVDGSIARWAFGSDSVRSSAIADADELIQTAGGPVVRRGSTIEKIGSPTRRLELPSSKSDVVAVSADMTRALLAERVPTLWDGDERIAMATGGGQILGAAFDQSSERVAIVLRAPDGLMLSFVDQRGEAEHRPLGNGSGCVGMPAWDGAARWVYVADGDGLLHAVEANGGRIESVKTQSAGCGVAWVDIA
jgi:hypothetical protein